MNVNTSADSQSLIFNSHERSNELSLVYSDYRAGKGVTLVVRGRETEQSGSQIRSRGVNSYAQL